ncbi:MAG: carbohydrate ABC transporter permease [Candidatus Limnocylindria bacterium]
MATAAIARPAAADTTERVERTQAVFRYILYIVVTLFLFVPFVMTLLSSFKTSAEVIAYPPTILPNVWHPENYAQVFSANTGFLRQVINGFVVTLLLVAMNLFFCSLVAYAFARLKFPGRDVLFAIMLGTMVIPGWVTMVPKYILIQNLGLINTFGALLTQYYVTPFGIFLMAQFFKSIPKELEEAALMDGLGWFGIFRRIILPLARPALLTLGILAFKDHWNNYFDWLIYMQTPDQFNIQLGLAAFRGVYQNQWDLIMAGSVIAILPILIVYAFGQRYFVRGIATTGGK